MTPRIEKLNEKKLVGFNITMSLTENKTGQLWSQFSPRIKEIQTTSSEDRISLQIYPKDY